MIVTLQPNFGVFATTRHLKTFNVVNIMNANFAQRIRWLRRIFLVVAYSTYGINDVRGIYHIAQYKVTAK
jgi:hypothetical protein